MLKLKLNRTLAFSLQHLALPSIGDCLKEIEETEYWLELLVDSGCVSATTMADLLVCCNSRSFTMSDLF
jgi:hypothetical protein